MTGVQTCALPILASYLAASARIAVLLSTVTHILWCKNRHNARGMWEGLAEPRFPGSTTTRKRRRGGARLPPSGGFSIGEESCGRGSPSRDSQAQRLPASVAAAERASHLQGASPSVKSHVGGALRAAIPRLKDYRQAPPAPAETGSRKRRRDRRLQPNAEFLVARSSTATPNNATTRQLRTDTAGTARAGTGPTLQGSMGQRP